MKKLNVLELANHVSVQSVTGFITDELLSAGNDLYEATQEFSRFRRIAPTGEVTEGYFQDNTFIVERVIVL